jgi:hypothetical protein
MIDAKARVALEGLGDREATLRTSVKPGTTLPVKDGQVIAPPADASQVPAG